MRANTAISEILHKSKMEGKTASALIKRKNNASSASPLDYEELAFVLENLGQPRRYIKYS